MQSLEKLIGAYLEDSSDYPYNDYEKLISDLNSLHYFYIDSAEELCKPDFYVGNVLSLPEETLSIPFENCWFEFIKPVRITFVQFDVLLYGFGILETSPEAQTIFFSAECINADSKITHRLRPLYSVLQFETGAGFIGQFESSNSAGENKLTNNFYSILVLAIRLTLEHKLNNRHLIYVENQEKLAIRGRVKGVFKKVKYHPSDVIYVLPRKEFDALPVSKKVKVKVINKPKYAYEVMGHWRMLQSTFSIGKDRHGVRGVRGYTWVSAHTRGDGDIMKKTRIVRT